MFGHGTGGWGGKSGQFEGKSSNALRHRWSKIEEAAHAAAEAIDKKRQADKKVPPKKSHKRQIPAGGLEMWTSKKTEALKKEVGLTGTGNWATKVAKLGLQGCTPRQCQMHYYELMLAKDPRIHSRAAAADPVPSAVSAALQANAPAVSVVVESSEERVLREAVLSSAEDAVEYFREWYSMSGPFAGRLAVKLPLDGA